jgi:hypothetical protein
MRRQSIGAQKAAERRERENAAKRLAEVVPDLRQMTMRIHEGPEGVEDSDVAHTRIIVVARAPALFEVGCSDRKCNGGHDLTQRVLKALKQHKEHFEGTDRCTGHVTDAECRLELRFVVDASYVN